MPAPKKTPARKAAPKARGPRSNTSTRPVKLPPITVQKLEETGRLIERLITTNRELFIQLGNDYKEVHRLGTDRPLSALESAQLAAALKDADERPVVEIAQDLQTSSLRAYDEPQSQEMLVQIGVSAAPQFVTIVRELVALVEMPADTFKEACEHDFLEQTIEEEAKKLRDLQIGELRARAIKALEHYAESAGFQPGEAFRLPLRVLWQALQMALSKLLPASGLSQLIDSAESTADSPETTSSTNSAG